MCNQPIGGQLIARDVPDAYFQAAGYQTHGNMQSGVIPQGYRAVADYGRVVGLHQTYTSNNHQSMQHATQLGGQQRVDFATRIGEVILTLSTLIQGRLKGRAGRATA